MYDSVETNTQFDLAKFLADGNGSEIRDAQLNRSHMLAATLRGVRVLKSSFTELTAYDSRFDGGQILFSEFESGELNHFTFDGVYLKGVLFKNVQMRNTRFVNCVFDSCSFQFPHEAQPEDNLTVEGCTYMSPDFLRDDLVKQPGVHHVRCLFFADSLPAHLVPGNVKALVSSSPVQNDRAKATVVVDAPAIAPAVPTQKMAPQESAEKRPESKTGGATRFDKLEI